MIDNAVKQLKLRRGDAQGTRLGLRVCGLTDILYVNCNVDRHRRPLDKGRWRGLILETRFYRLEFKMTISKTRKRIALNFHKSDQNGWLSMFNNFHSILINFQRYNIFYKGKGRRFYRYTVNI